MNVKQNTQLNFVEETLHRDLEAWRQRLVKRYINARIKQNSVWIGEPLLAIVDFHADFAEVFLPMPHVVSTHNWSLQPTSQGIVSLTHNTFTDFVHLIQHTINARQQTFTECACCGKRTSPEFIGLWHDEPVCHLCLSEQKIL